MQTINEIEVQDPEPPAAGGIGISDILRMLFKHKWKLILAAVLSFSGAAAVYLNHVPHYESTSKILVRYVEDVSNVDTSTQGRGQGAGTVDSIIGAEMEILQSWDLANQVVDTISPAVIMGGNPNSSHAKAAQAFMKNLDVVAPKGSQVITVTYRHPDPDVAVNALTSLVKLYREKHVEIHRATKSRETARMRRTALAAKLSALTEKIEQLKSDNGISSLAEAAKGLNERSDDLRKEIGAAEADLQEQTARVAELKRLGLVKDLDPKSAQAQPSGTAPLPQESATPDRAAHFEYQGVLKRLTQLQDQKKVLEDTVAPNSAAMRKYRQDAAALDAERARLEAQHPTLLATGPAIVPGGALPPLIDPTVETVRLATLTARVQFLQKRQEAMKEEFKQFAAVSRDLHELERERDMQTEGIRQFAAAFQRNDFENPLRADEYDNIPLVQESSPPILALSKLLKLVAGIFLGGIGAAVALVALLELVINRSVKRPLELETRVGIPLMCNIPRIAARQRLTLQDRKKKGLPDVVGIEPWSNTHFIRPFAEALRDRLVLHFEQVGLTRKPKLVGVASYSKGAGVSTVASGIASALSETGDGKVLLVDMSPARAEVHPFFDGKPAATLAEALESGTKMESAAENLYLATATSPNGKGGAGQLFPKRFYDLMPTFQASDFDYIIFDMPPMDESSLTLAMSGFMDKLLLVVEAEKDNRDAIKRASGELIRARAKLSGVLNKTRSYGPKWLQEA